MPSLDQPLLSCAVSNARLRAVVLALGPSLALQTLAWVVACFALGFLTIATGRAVPLHWLATATAATWIVRVTVFLLLRARGSSRSPRPWWDAGPTYLLLLMLTLCILIWTDTELSRVLHGLIACVLLLASLFPLSAVRTVFRALSRLIGEPVLPDLSDSNYDAVGAGERMADDATATRLPFDDSAPYRQAAEAAASPPGRSTSKSDVLERNSDPLDSIKANQLGGL